MTRSQGSIGATRDPCASNGLRRNQAESLWLGIQRRSAKHGMSTSPIRAAEGRSPQPATLFFRGEPTGNFKPIGRPMASCCGNSTLESGSWRHLWRTKWTGRSTSRYSPDGADPRCWAIEPPAKERLGQENFYRSRWEGRQHWLLTSEWFNRFRCQLSN